MSMEPLNYCRQVVRQFSEKIAIPSFPEYNRQVLSAVIDLANASQKFILPIGGRLFDDLQFKALDETEPLSLPYEFVALEYRSLPGPVEPGSQPQSKRIVFARQRDEWIVITIVSYVDHIGIWGPLPEIALPRVRYLDRSFISEQGRCGIRIKFPNDLPREVQSDYQDEVGALLCFLNALQCSNVHIEDAPQSKTRKAMRKALPFDSYHVLTIDQPKAAGDAGASRGSRSPREHLRRGHIRRYDSGLKVWVNATVVNAGVGGKVRKDYALKA